MHFYIVHGYQASPGSHWFPWLEQQLAADGHTVHTIALPHPNAPELDEWVEAIGRVIARPSADGLRDISCGFAACRVKGHFVWI